jgi:hypothetical protein
MQCVLGAVYVLTFSVRSCSLKALRDARFDIHCYPSRRRRLLVLSADGAFSRFCGCGDVVSCGGGGWDPCVVEDPDLYKPSVVIDPDPYKY